MGSTLSDPDFITTRGPRDARLASGIGPPIPYTLSADINEHFPTDGSPRTFYSIARVKAESKWDFIKSILADVYEDTANPMTGAASQMSLTGITLSDRNVEMWTRNPLIRLNPQRHPIHQRAFAVDAVVLNGLGYPMKSPTGELSFRQFRPEQPASSQAAEGYVNIGITWKDLPYEVEITRLVLEMAITGTPTNGEGPGSTLATSTDISNTEANRAENSEIIRYCVFKPTPKGQNVQIPGGQAYFVDDNGSLVMADDGVTPVACPPEAQVYYNPATTFSVTWKMVPRIPYAVERLRGMCNHSQNIPIPFEILRDLPDTGTLRFLGYELSDPYYTCSGTKVFDITYSLGYRPGGNTSPNRGWNSAWCGKKREPRRFIFGKLFSGVVKTVDGLRAIPLPVTSDSQVDQSPRLTDAVACIAPFTDLQNLFRFEGTRIS